MQKWHNVKLLHSSKASPSNPNAVIVSEFERRRRVYFSVSVMSHWARRSTWSEEICNASVLVQSSSLTWISGALFLVIFKTCHFKTSWKQLIRVLQSWVSFRCTYICFSYLDIIWFYLKNKKEQKKKKRGIKEYCIQKSSKKGFSS